MLLRTGKRYVRTAHISGSKSISGYVRISAELRAQAIAVEREPDFVDSVWNPVTLEGSLDLSVRATITCPSVIRTNRFAAVDSK